MIRLKVWDAPVRLIHWSLAALIAFAWWTYQTDRMQWHRIAGYAVLALLAFRLLWGVFGSETARFANFVRGPGAVWRYLKGAPSALGHNPAGGWSVVILLGVLAAQTLVGLFSSDQDGLESGPLSDFIGFDRAQRLEQWHAVLFYVLLGLVAIHVLAIAFYAARGRNLLWPMITGRAAAPEGTKPPKQARIVALAVATALAAVVFTLLFRMDR